MHRRMQTVVKMSVFVCATFNTCRKHLDGARIPGRANHALKTFDFLSGRIRMSCLVSRLRLTYSLTTKPAFGHFA